MQIDVESNCPLNGFSPCKKLQCAWFTKIIGTNPQTGQQVDEWGCAIAWMPMLTIENSQQQRQTGAAVESFRNEMVKANNATLQLVSGQQAKTITLEQMPKQCHCPELNCIHTQGRKNV